MHQFDIQKALAHSMSRGNDDFFILQLMQRVNSAVAPYKQNIFRFNGLTVLNGKCDLRIKLFKIVEIEHSIHEYCIKIAGGKFLG